MSSMLYTYFLAASTTGAFLFNMALILFSAYAYPEEKNILTRRERDVRRTIFKTAVFEGVLALFAIVFNLRVFGVIPPSDTAGVTALVIAVLVALAQLGLSLPGFQLAMMVWTRRGEVAHISN